MIDNRSGMSLLLGRPSMIYRSDCNTGRPLDCDIPSEPLTTNPDVLVAHGLPFTFAERLLQYDVACKIHDARELGLDRVSPETYVLVQDMQNQLQSLLVALPPFLRPHDPDTSFDELCQYLPLQRETVLTSISSAVYSLHRPHLANHEESRLEVLSSTMSALESQERVFALTPERHYGMYTLSFYIIDAALLLMSTAAMYPLSAKESMQRIRQVLSRAMSNLSAIAHLNAIAGMGLTLLNRCFSRMNSILEASLDEVHVSNHSHDLASNLQETSQAQATAVLNNSWPTDQIEFVPNIDLNDFFEEPYWKQFNDSNILMSPPTNTNAAENVESLSQ
jgi:hypothetical protein